MNKQPISGQEVSNLTFINRIHVLEGIIFDLKEALRYYADEYNYEHGESDGSYIEMDGGICAHNILEKYNISWNELYNEVDKKYGR